MKAIITKGIPVTNTKPWRIKAIANGLPAKFYGLYELEAELIYDGLRTDQENTHRLAAEKYARQYGWLNDCEIVSGGVGDGQFAHVLRAKVGVEGCHLLDLEPQQNEETGLWEVVESDERGNAHTVHEFPKEEHALAFIAGWEHCGHARNQENSTPLTLPHVSEASALALAWLRSEHGVPEKSWPMVHQAILTLPEVHRVEATDGWFYLPEDEGQGREGYTDTQDRKDYASAPADKPLTLVVTMEGGLVQSVNADRPVDGLSVVIVDYDTEGTDDCDEVEQPDGGTASACVTEWGISPIHPVILKSINEILDA